MNKNIFLTCFTIVGLMVLSGCTKNNTLTALPGINSDNDKPVGASAYDLLSASKFTSVKVEVLYMPGFQPDAAALTNLTSFISSLVNKPSGINITQKQITASGKTTLSVNDIAVIEKDNRTVFTSGAALGISVIYTDGGYTVSNVLGIAYRNTSICIFEKTIQNNSGGVGQTSRTKLESTVLLHESGHLLGLVDIGSAMQTNHKDAANGNHCNNSNCLMYYSSETTDILGFLITGNIPSLDANCLADLHANGGK